jgi:hypothetical protein
MVDADPQARPEDRLKMRRVVLALTVLLACGGMLASELRADGPAPQAGSGPPGTKPADDSKLDLQKPEDDAPKAPDGWWQKVLREAPNCKSFTDGCRTCSQTVCSNIGIACQPRDWSCNDANPGAGPGTGPDAKPETKPDEKPESKQ